ncbi:hypothetical protein Tco_0868403 [Tanacetum coccineum]
MAFIQLGWVSRVDDGSVRRVRSMGAKLGLLAGFLGLGGKFGKRFYNKLGCDRGWMKMIKVSVESNSMAGKLCIASLGPDVIFNCQQSTCDSDCLCIDPGFYLKLCGGASFL